MRNRTRVLLSAFLLLGPILPGLSQKGDLTGEFPLEAGDSFARIEKVLGKGGTLKESSSPASAYSYSFPEHGVTLFLGEDKAIRSVRFAPPFKGTVKGIAIGDTFAHVKRILGKPSGSPPGMPDPSDRSARETKKQAILDALPDMVPKARVLEVFEQLKRIDQAPLVSLEGHLFRFKDGAFLNVQVSPEDSRVRLMFN